MSIERKYFNWCVLLVLVLSASLFLYIPNADAQTAKDLKPAASAKVTTSWQSPVKLQHTVRKEHGTIVMSAEGVEFRSAKGRTLKWPFLEIKTFSVSSHSLTLETYTSRNKHLPGMQQYRFAFDQAVPPEVAAELGREVQRPSRNAVPDPALTGIRNVFAHHRTRTGGTNGTLRFRKDGIDYLTSVAEDNRSWRWADLQTLSKPDPYHLLVFGYRDTYAFDLKETVSQSLLNWLTDEVASHNESESRLLP